MPKFFQVEKAAFGGGKNEFSNVEFKKRALENSNAAEAGTVLEIIPLHIKNPPVIQFIAYISKISDTIKSSHTKEQPFGRTDPYYMWKASDRSITLSVDVPSSSITMGLENLNNLSWFAASMYPTYKDSQTATSIAASPMFRVRFGNLVCSSTNDGQGLPGVIQSLAITHDAKAGFIGGRINDAGASFPSEVASVLKSAGFDNTVRDGKNILIPKLMTLGFTLNVVHDHKLGWDFNTGEFRGGLGAPRFPYDFGLVRDTSESPVVGPTVSVSGQSAVSPPGGADNRQTGVSTELIDAGSKEDDLSKTDLAKLDNEEESE